MKTKYTQQDYDKNRTLHDYKTKYFFRDKTRYSLTHLRHEDQEDLMQELYLTCFKLLKSGLGLRASKMQNYCNKAYQNTVRRFAGKYIRSSKMTYMDPQELYDALSDCREDPPDYPFYWEMDVLHDLTNLEKDVVFLKCVKGCKNGEIIRLLKYTGGNNGLWQICSRARKRLLEKCPVLGQK